MAGTKLQSLHFKEFAYLPQALCIPELVEKILEYVLGDPEDCNPECAAASCKEICSTWEGICSDILTSKNCFFLDPSQEDESILKEYLDKVHWKFQSFICWLMLPKITRIVFQKIGFQIQELQLRIGNYGTVADFEDLLQVLKKYCPKLRTFYISFSSKEIVPKGMFSHAYSYMLPIRNLIALDINNVKQLRFVQKIVENSPWISKIRLTTDEIPVVTGVLRTIINSPQTMRTLKELYLPRPFLHSRSPLLLNYFVYNNWRLSTFQTSVGSSVLLKDVQLLLGSFSETLQTLQIDFDECVMEIYEEDMEEANFQDYLIIPLSLTKLKKLMMCHVPSKSLALVNALLLPKLAHFEFNTWECGCDGNQSFQEVSDWVGMPLVNPCVSVLNLKHVNDFTIFNCTSNPWNNLQELELSTESAGVVQAIFQNVKSLVRLQLSVTGRQDDSWMRILTGKRKASVGLGFRFDRPSIRHLKRLKWLKVMGSRNSDLVFTDMFIFHGLMSLKELQYVQLQYTDFTNMAVEILRTSLLPFCRLDFHRKLMSAV